MLARAALEPAQPRAPTLGTLGLGGGELVVDHRVGDRAVARRLARREQQRRDTSWLPGVPRTVSSARHRVVAAAVRDDGRRDLLEQSRGRTRSFCAAVSAASNAAAACAAAPCASPCASAARDSSRCARARSHGASFGESSAADSDIRAAASSPAASCARPSRIFVAGPGARLRRFGRERARGRGIALRERDRRQPQRGRDVVGRASARCSALFAAAGKPSAQ